MRTLFTFFCLPVLLTLSIATAACDSAPNAGSGDDTCDDLLAFLQECEGSECATEEATAMLNECENNASVGEAKADIENWLISKLSSEARICFEKRDANCMWYVYKGLAAGAMARGYLAAGNNLHHFLGNSGRELSMFSNSFTNDRSVQEEIAIVVRELDNHARTVGNGQVRTVNLGARVVHSSGQSLHLAVGSFTLYGTAQVRRDGNGQLRYDINFRVRDVYDWHAGNGVPIGRSGFSDAWAQLMVSGRVARPFNISASWNQTVYR